MTDRLAPFADQIAAWKKEHGKVYELNSGSGLDLPARLQGTVFIVRQPSRAELSRLLRDAGKDPLGQITNLLLDITLTPSRAELGQLLEQVPALAVSLQTGLQQSCGLGIDFSAREL